VSDPQRGVEREVEREEREGGQGQPDRGAQAIETMPVAITSAKYAGCIRERGRRAGLVIAVA
jgi:hypothetical protein